MLKIYHFQLLKTFFGLGSKDRPGIFRQVFDLTFHGQGGFSWSEVYNMPVWMRKYCIQQANEHYSEQQKKHDEAMSRAQRSSTTKNPRPPQFFSKK
jgi:hypothetical protein